MNTPNIEQLVQQGIAATRSGQHEQAHQLLRQAVHHAPDNEQAWLWLSGVEPTDQGKIAALQNVLRINPNNAAAQRGINLLTKPKDLDFASIVSNNAAPPPAKAAGMPAPPRATFTPPPPITKPAVEPIASPQVEVKAVTPVVEAVPPPVVEPTLSESAPEHISSDVVDALRPAIEKSKKRRILPSTSEWAIMGVLVLLLFGGFKIMQNSLGKQFSNDDVNSSFPTSAPNAAQPDAPQATQAPNLQITQVPVAQPTKAPQSGVGVLQKSRAYNVQVDGASIDQAKGEVVVAVSLTNPFDRQVFARTTDFSLSSGGSRLTLDKARSTLFDAQGRANLAAGGSASGQIVWTGNVADKGTKLVWQPSNGGVNVSIPLQ